MFGVEYGALIGGTSDALVSRPIYVYIYICDASMAAQMALEPMPSA